VWWQRNIQGKKSYWKLGNLDMECLCDNHIDHIDCNTNCHGGITDDKVFDAQPPLKVLSDFMNSSPTHYKCKTCGKVASSEFMIKHLQEHGLVKRKIIWEDFSTILVPTVENLNPDYIEPVSQNNTKVAKST